MSDLASQDEIVSYIRANPVAVLGTVGQDDTPHGAAVFVYPATSDKLYFITKAETQKMIDIKHNPKVSVTIVNQSENSSLQAVGHVQAETNPQMIELVLERMDKIYARSADWLPPIAKIRAGSYEVASITLEHVRMAYFLGKHVGSEEIFRET